MAKKAFLYRNIKQNTTAMKAGDSQPFVTMAPHSNGVQLVIFTETLFTKTRRKCLAQSKLYYVVGNFKDSPQDSCPSSQRSLVISILPPIVGQFGE